MHSSDSELPRDDRLALVVLAVAQSLGLLLLHKALTHDAWPSTDPRWLYALYTVAIGLPLFLYAGAVRWRDRYNAYAAVVLAVLLFWVGWHAGWLTTPEFEQSKRNSESGPGFIFSMSIALFIAGFYFRSWREAGRLDYARLLDNSWRNALTLGFLVAFLGAFWLLLVLWAALFKVIQIDFFSELFMRSEFVYPITGLVGGWGLGLIRARVGLVATVRRLCEVLIRALLPLVAFILIIFLGTLPVTGLEQLWKTGYASGLLLSLAVVLLFFFNAMVADDDAISLHRWLMPLVLAALVLVPANSGLAAWAMGLRVGQYGWTVDREWGAFVILFVALYSVGYAAIVLRHRAMNVAAMRRLNITLGALLAIALFVVNTPLIEFHRIAAKSQVERLVSGRTKIADFDARYLRWELGPYGIAQLEALKTGAFALEKPEIVKVVSAALAQTERWGQREMIARTDPSDIRSRFTLLPGTVLEDEFLLQLGEAQAGAGNLWYCYENDPICVVGEFEHRGQRYRALSTTAPSPGGKIWRKAAQGWVRIGALRQFGCPEGKQGGADPTLPFTPLDSDFFVLKNGSCLYQVLPERDALDAWTRGRDATS